MTDDELRVRAKEWLAEDPDPVTRAELEVLLAADDLGGLADRFDSRLQFGTAGLRGRLGAGPNRMNRVLVRRAAAGLACYLHQQGSAGSGVVIGYDARHRSRDFAADTASVLAGAGIPAAVLPRALPTPLLAFAVGDQHAAAGIMVTASHNPPEYNGYKVYMGDGAQIVPPTDARISAQIDAVTSSAAVPWAAPGSPLITTLGEDIIDRYLAQAGRRTFEPAARQVEIVYTPMHGVGASVALRLLAESGFDQVSVVGAQAAPDPNFPTVAFPNPEEPGALDLAIAHATRRHADLVLANDPDADRLGVAVPSREGSGWAILRGDEIGVLLADHVLRHTDGDDRLVVTTIVSSSLLRAMAAAAGVHYAETLTGFKWIVRAGDTHPDWRFVFGYEEALGYCLGPTVRDKDGITAALVFAEVVAALKAQGRTVYDRLDELAAEHGAHVTDQWSITLDGTGGRPAGRMANLMDGLRSAPPSRLDGRPVTQVDDLLAGHDLPPTDALILRCGDQRRVMLRPSGTEPKLKVYFEAVEPVVAGDVTAARVRGAAAVAGLRRALASATGVAHDGAGARPQAVPNRRSPASPSPG